MRGCRPSSAPPKTPRYASLPTNAMARGRRSRARRKSRSAEPAKSRRRRSPDPGVVRNAAFVSPTPYRSASNCSSGASRRGVKPASCSNRQKSLRGFAKCAPAAAETRPGLIPQKTTRRPAARTSGTALLGTPSRLRSELRLALVQQSLEELTELLSGDPALGAWLPGLDPDQAYARVPRAVAAEIALRLAQRSQPTHRSKLRAAPDGSLVLQGLQDVQARRPLRRQDCRHDPDEDRHDDEEPDRAPRHSEDEPLAREHGRDEVAEEDSDRDPQRSPDQSRRDALEADHQARLPAGQPDRAQHPQLASSLEDGQDERVDDPEHAHDDREREQDIEEVQDAVQRLLEVLLELRLSRDLGVGEGVLQRARQRLRVRVADTALHVH